MSGSLICLEHLALRHWFLEGSPKVFNRTSSSSHIGFRERGGSRCRLVPKAPLESQEAGGRLSWRHHRSRTQASHRYLIPRCVSRLDFGMKTTFSSIIISIVTDDRTLWHYSIDRNCAPNSCSNTTTSIWRWYTRHIFVTETTESAETLTDTREQFTTRVGRRVIVFNVCQNLKGSLIRISDLPEASVMIEQLRVGITPRPQVVF